MKKIMIAVFSLLTLVVKAQTAEEVVEKYANAMGGLDAFSRNTSAKMTGTVTVQGMDLPITIQIVNGKSMRAEVEAMGKTIVNVYNDGKGWKTDPFNGTGDPVDVDGEELVSYKQQSSMVNGLMNYRGLGNKIELTGDETIDGVKNYKIKMTSKEDGKETTYYVRSNDYGLTKSFTTRNLGGQDMEIETDYSDLKDVGGLKMYMTRSQQTAGQVFQTISFTKVELNVPIDPKIFNK